MCAHNFYFFLWLWLFHCIYIFFFFSLVRFVFIDKERVLLFAFLLVSIALCCVRRASFIQCATVCLCMSEPRTKSGWSHGRSHLMCEFIFYLCRMKTFYDLTMRSVTAWFIRGAIFALIFINLSRRHSRTLRSRFALSRSLNSFCCCCFLMFLLPYCLSLSDCDSVTFW